MPRLYLASNNRHKISELQSLLNTLGNSASHAPLWQLNLASELVPGGISWDETGDTFLANAKIKAEAVKAHTGECVLADDSGLEVDVLGGLPGVHSSRYASASLQPASNDASNHVVNDAGKDTANNEKLLRATSAFDEAALTARFVCTLYFIHSNGDTKHFSGVCEGRLTKSPRGANGFGYDPLFVVDQHHAHQDHDSFGKTMAELTDMQKNKVSHRRKAVDAWLAWLRQQTV